jgi:hypothetical protein
MTKQYARYSVWEWIAFIIVSFILCCCVANAQSTTVSVTATDTGGQVWIGGSISYQWTNPQYPNNPTWQGVPLPNNYKAPTVVILDSTGSATFTIPSTTAISPSGALWAYTICPNAPVKVCQTINLPATGNTQNISSNVSAILPPVSISAMTAPFAYQDGEVITPPTPGALYFNTISQNFRQWTGTVWTPIGGGGQNTGPFFWSSIITPYNSVPQAASINSFTVQANAIIDLNHNQFSDGTDYWSAGPAYASFGVFLDDFTLALLSNPAKFTDAQVLNILNKAINFRNNSGWFPIAIPQNLSSADFCSGYDLHCLNDGSRGHATGDGWITVPQLLYQHYLKTGDLTAYTADVGYIKTAFAAIPVNSSSHLLTVNTGDEYVCGTAFMEYMRNTGDVANCNVWYAVDLSIMSSLALAAGDSANVTFFNSLHNTIVSGIRSILIDGTSGLLITATGQNSVNLDEVSSSLAVFCDSPAYLTRMNVSGGQSVACGILTGAQKTAIANYFNTNYSTLVNSNGYILQSPTPWNVIGQIPTTGGTPYNSIGFSNTQYQGGYWSFTNSWFAASLNLVNNPQIATLLSTFLGGADVGTEYYNRGSTSPAGTTPNLESPQAMKAAFDMYPSPITLGVAGGCINQYGAVVGSGCIGPGVNNLTGPIILNFGSGTGPGVIYTGASTVNTSSQYCNTSASSNCWLLFENGSGAGATAAYFGLTNASGELPWIAAPNGNMTFTGNDTINGTQTINAQTAATSLIQTLQSPSTVNTSSELCNTSTGGVCWQEFTNGSAAGGTVGFFGFRDVTNGITPWALNDQGSQQTSVMVTGAAPTAPSGAVSIGGTTATATNCNQSGTLTGVVGCLIINVAGTVHYVPYF